MVFLAFDSDIAVSGMDSDLGKTLEIKAFDLQLPPEIAGTSKAV